MVAFHCEQRFLERSMINPVQLEKSFQEFTADLPRWMPDGIVCVDLPMLHEMGILKEEQLQEGEDDSLMHYFHVIESEEKVTLFNEQFAIWIVPQMVKEAATTLTFVASIHKQQLALQVAFSSSGVYNTPRYILRILQSFLKEIIETEATLSSLEKKEE